MAQIPDLRVCDPSRPGIGVDTVAIPDLIDSLKAFNEEWVRFENDLDTARVKELISICKSAEMLWRALGTRVLQVRASLRIEKFDTLERKLESMHAKQAALMAHTLKEESLLMNGVNVADTQEWINKRISVLQKRINNRKNWMDQKAIKYAKAS